VGGGFRVGLSYIPIPKYLLRYVVKQHYDQYTAENHATWRYIMRQLKSFLSQYAHPSYLEGLKRTGITIDRIPNIEDIDKKLQKLGWRAVPVSGFIPPVAFMEFQLNNILPIASAMRTVSHVSYTPAPDIVHEAAGHTPFLINPAFNSFLKKYAQVVRKAITNKKDFEQYSAIRRLSDIKEDPNASIKEIKKIQSNLERINSDMDAPSEASLLSRFIWWTSEYGLIGSLKNQKIYGAGLLSSIGEAKKCLSSDVKKIPLDSSCIEYSYDITDYQPQLFVTPDFETLHTVLDELQKKCAFYRGGEYGLKQAKKAETVCTIELETGLQISGVLTDYITVDDTMVGTAFIKLQGACQLSYQGKQLEGHGVKTHSDGYSSPLGILKDKTSLHKLNISDFQKKYERNGYVSLEYFSGFKLRGKLINFISKKDHLILLQFTDCVVCKGDNVYYRPEWGVFDLALGEKVQSVFGGPADRFSYGDLAGFEVAYVPSGEMTDEQEKVNIFYDKIRRIRESEKKDVIFFKELMDKYNDDFSTHWLAGVELLELAYILKESKEKEFLKRKLTSITHKKDEKKPFIKKAIQLIEQEYS